MVNFMLRDETWFVHSIADDAKAVISPILPDTDEGTLIRLLRYIGLFSDRVGTFGGDPGRPRKYQ